MALADRLKDAEPPCKVCALLGWKLSAEDADTLRTWLKDRVPAPKIERALAAEGHKVSAASIKRHRIGHQ